MIQATRDQLLALYGMAADHGPLSDTHVADDEMLTAWREGLLTEAEEGCFFTHLDACPECRRTVIALVVPTVTPRPARP